MATFTVGNGFCHINYQSHTGDQFKEDKSRKLQSLPLTSCMEVHTYDPTKPVQCLHARIVIYWPKYMQNNICKTAKMLLEGSYFTNLGETIQVLAQAHHAKTYRIIYVMHLALRSRGGAVFDTCTTRLLYCNVPLGIPFQLGQPCHSTACK